MNQIIKEQYQHYLHQTSPENLIKEFKDVCLFKLAQGQDLWMYDCIKYEMLFRMKRG